MGKERVVVDPGQARVFIRHRFERIDAIDGDGGRSGLRAVHGARAGPADGSGETGRDTVHVRYPDIAGGRIACKELSGNEIDRPEEAVEEGFVQFPPAAEQCSLSSRVLAIDGLCIPVRMQVQGRIGNAQHGRGNRHIEAPQFLSCRCVEDGDTGVAEPRCKDVAGFCPGREPDDAGSGQELEADLVHTGRESLHADTAFLGEILGNQVGIHGEQARAEDADRGLRPLFAVVRRREERKDGPGLRAVREREGQQEDRVLPFRRERIVVVDFRCLLIAHVIPAFGAEKVTGAVIGEQVPEPGEAETVCFVFRIAGKDMVTVIADHIDAGIPRRRGDVAATDVAGDICLITSHVSGSGSQSGDRPVDPFFAVGRPEDGHSAEGDGFGKGRECQFPPVGQVARVDFPGPFDIESGRRQRQGQRIGGVAADVEIGGIVPSGIEAVAGCSADPEPAFEGDFRLDVGAQVRIVPGRTERVGRFPGRIRVSRKQVALEILREIQGPPPLGVGFPCDVGFIRGDKPVVGQAGVERCDAARDVPHLDGPDGYGIVPEQVLVRQDAEVDPGEKALCRKANDPGVRRESGRGRQGHGAGHRHGPPLVMIADKSAGTV